MVLDDRECDLLRPGQPGEVVAVGVFGTGLGDPGEVVVRPLVDAAAVGGRAEASQADHVGGAACGFSQLFKVLLESGNDVGNERTPLFMQALPVAPRFGG